MKRLILTALVFYLITGLALKGKTSRITGDGSNFAYNFIQYPETLYKDLPLKIYPFNLEIIPPSSGIQFYKDGIVFLSHSKVEDRMISDHISFGTLGTYYTSLTDTAQGEHLLFSQADPFAVPSESMTFNRDYSAMFFAKRLKNNDSEKIYEADYNSGRNGSGVWISHDEPLSFCSDNSTYTHPSLSVSGDMLVFASNRRGNSGGLDLYVTHKVGDSWSSPENLGKSVNTVGNELFPFLDKENNLYFSSDGHKGIGGYDIYFSKFNGKYWDKPVGLTNVINSQNDELALRINPRNGTSAFFTVRQKSGDRSFRLLMITFPDQYSLNKFMDLSNALKFIAGIDINPFEIARRDSAVLAQTTVTETKTEKPVIKPQKESERQPAQRSDQTPAVNVKQPGTKPVEPSKEPTAQTASKPVQIQGKSGTKAEVSKPESVSQPQTGDLIVYRVQFFSSQKSKGSYNLTVESSTYKTFEYLYNGLYRSCVGEYNSVADAREFLKQFKQAGYNDAFVVVFKNNQRSLDPALLK